MNQRLKRVALRTAHIVLLCALTAALCEGMAYCAYVWTTGTRFSHEALRLRQQAVAQEKAAGFGETATSGGEVLHPYLGYVYNPAINNPYFTKVHGFPVSSYGFIDDKSPLLTRSPSTAIVAITGGSVAYWFSSSACASFTNALEKSGAFSGKRVIVVRLALGGYKQPQQLMTLSYLLAQGAEFDALVNIDGFNEVALPPAENLPKHVNPYYPRNWFYRLQTLPTDRMRLLTGKVAYLREQRATLAASFVNSPLRHSVAFNVFWAFRDKYAAAQIGRAAVELLSEQPHLGDNDFSVTGPAYDAKNPASVAADLARSWQQSSLQMHRLCRANGISYHHFLQPVATLDGAKVLTAHEQAVCRNPASPFASGVTNGYPLLKAAGTSLLQSGVSFHDLTTVFARESSDIFIDDAGHVNQQGNVLLGAAVGEAVAADLCATNGPQPALPATKGAQ